MMFLAAVKMSDYISHTGYHNNYTIGYTSVGSSSQKNKNNLPTISANK